MDVRRVTKGLLAGLALGLSTPAWAITCDEIIQMVDVNVPTQIVVQTMEGSGTKFTDSDIRCLSEGGAPDEVVDAARKMAAEAAAAEDEKPMPDDEGDDGGGGGSKFDNTEALGDDVGPDGGGDDEEDAGGGPADIEQLIKLYRSKKVLGASKGFYDLLEEGQYPDQESKLHYYLAKSLFDLGMYHGAQHYFMQVVRKGPRNPYFKYALPKLVAIAKLTGNDTELLRIVHKIPPDAFPRQAKNHLFYLMGVKLYENEELSNSLKYFQQISPKSDLYLRSKYIEGVVHKERGKMKSAVKAFRDVYQSQATPVDARELKAFEDLKDLALMNIARIYYELDRYDNADNYYSQVDRGSTYWPESLFERAWTNFIRNDLNLTLGLLLTLRSPYYEQYEYNPEAQLLRALTFFQICEHAQAEKILLEFEDTYGPMRQEIKDFLAEYDTEEGRKLADQAYDAYFDKNNKDSRLSKAMFLKILRNKDLNSLVSHLELMDAEIELVNQQKGVWRDSIGSHLKKVIEEDRQRYKRRAGLVLLQEMARQYQKLGDWMSQSQIIRFEIVDAQRADYEFKMSNPDVESLEDRTVDFAVSKEVIYWPFNGEFWQDELGYYRYTEKGDCN